MAKTKILIVDDEADVVQALQFRLETAGYQTLSALNGAEALQVLQQDPVDLILTDFMMPEINGLELTRRVRENPAWTRTKVVLFSVNAEVEFQQRAKELGAVDYLPKTNGAGFIVTRVYELLGPEQELPRSTLPAVPAVSISRTSPDALFLSQQIRTIADGVVDFLHLARMSDELSPATSYALDSAEAMAEELHRLSTALEAGVVPLRAPRPN